MSKMESISSLLTFYQTHYTNHAASSIPLTANPRALFRVIYIFGYWNVFSILRGELIQTVNYFDKYVIQVFEASDRSDGPL